MCDCFFSDVGTNAAGYPMYVTAAVAVASIFGSNNNAIQWQLKTLYKDKSITYCLCCCSGGGGTYYCCLFNSDVHGIVFDAI